MIMITYRRMLLKMGALIIWSTELLSILNITFGIGGGLGVVAVLLEGKLPKLEFRLRCAKNNWLLL